MCHGHQYSHLPESYQYSLVLLSFCLIFTFTFFLFTFTRFVSTFDIFVHFFVSIMRRVRICALTRKIKVLWSKFMRVSLPLPTLSHLIFRGRIIKKTSTSAVCPLTKYILKPPFWASIVVKVCNIHFSLQSCASLAGV